MATAVFLTDPTDQAIGGSGVGGSRDGGREGPHHHQQDFTIFSLWREPLLLVITIKALSDLCITCFPLNSHEAH